MQGGAWASFYGMHLPPPNLAFPANQRKKKVLFWTTSLQRTFDKHQAGFQSVVSLYHNTTEGSVGLMGGKLESGHS